MKTDFYLITGFLGAGKTTFLQNLIALFPGKRLQLIINEFGRAGVDGMLLAKTQASLQEITGGSVFCSCRLDQFEEALAQGLSQAPDVLLVEASGLADPTNIRHILEQAEAAGQLTYKGCICLVDALCFHKVFATARVVKKQLAVADLVLLNKTDLADRPRVAAARAAIAAQFPALPLQETQFGAIDPQWLAALAPFRRRDSAPETADLTLQRATVGIAPHMSLYEIERFIALFAEDTSRVKGFVLLEDRGWHLVDCVGPHLQLSPWEGALPATSGLTVLATAGAPLRKALKYAASLYGGKVTLQFH